ncbi:uncharacterized protein MONBRDRAFT_1658, partial [Monosiga brevicollis MX1]
RRHLHEHPELSWQEHQTAAYVRRQIIALGLSPRDLCTTGLICDVPDASGSTAGPKIAIRADLDALPIQEATALPFASQSPGIMHACGHDGHTAMGLGALRLLIAGEAPPLPVRFIFQPAEELATGSAAMIKAGALEDVVAVFGGHLDNRYPCGTFIVHEGCVNASTDTVRIEVQGKAGHAARPHQCVDAVVLASSIVMQLQTLVARTVDPGRPAVVTIGRLQAGTAYNVVAGNAVLEGTIRCTDADTRALLLDRVAAIATGTATTLGGSARTTFSDGVPPVINSPRWTAVAREAVLAVGGQPQPLPTANLGAEDFANYLQHVPGFFVRYG